MAVRTLNQADLS